MMRVAKIKDGEIVNVEMWDAVPADGNGFTYMAEADALQAGIPRRQRQPRPQRPRVVASRKLATYIRTKNINEAFADGAITEAEKDLLLKNL